MKKASLTSLNKRLLPLYIAVFFQGFTLWYAIEKLFMHQIGFNDAGIGVMVAAYCVIVLAVETPSGILADRWSRKGVLVLACIALGLSGLLCGISTEPSLYIVGAMLWGVFYALYSGTYDSIVYDTVLEETGDSSLYERYLGRIRIADSTALVIGALSGGIVAQFAGLESTFLWSIPAAAIAIIALMKFNEPQLHKAEPLGTIKEQITETFGAVFRRRLLLRLLIALVMISLAIDALYEFNQLWFIAINTSPLLFGPLTALVISTIGIGSYLAGRVKSGRKAIIALCYGALGGSTVTLALATDFSVILAAQTVMGTSAVLLSVLYTADLHDALPSRVRAGAASAVSTVSRALLIPLGLLFGIISAEQSIFTASWLLVTVICIAAVFEFLPYLRQLQFTQQRP